MSTARTISAITAALAVAVSGCSPASVPASSTPAADGADVTLMDTGPYATIPSPPFGTAGDSGKSDGSELEAQRIAAYTVAPWQADTALTTPGWRLNVIQMGSLYRTELFPSPITPDAVSLKLVDDSLDTGALTEHRMVAGFSTYRASGYDDLPPTSARYKQMQSALQTLVLAFPNQSAATAAADDMAANVTGKPLEIPGHPDARAISDEVPGPETFEPAADGELVFAPIGVSSTVVHSFTTVGAVVLIEIAQAPNQDGSFYDGNSFTPDLKWLVASALSKQKSLIKDYVPTPADKLADLPMDPSGWLLSRTLIDLNDVSALGGVWKPKAWLHFEDDPVTAATLFADAGVDWIAQGTATVYQARSAEAAEIMLEKMVGALSAMPSVEAGSAVPGLPQARCFRRPTYARLPQNVAEYQAAMRDAGPNISAAPPGSSASWLRVGWPFKCAAAADRWVFTVYAESMSDAAQRISAQYRILARR